VDVAVENRKWFDPVQFPELPLLQGILRTTSDGERLSRLPFDRFIRIA
jgi:hypothetical protein